MQYVQISTKLPFYMDIAIRRSVDEDVASRKYSALKNEDNHTPTHTHVHTLKKQKKVSEALCLLYIIFISTFFT